MASSGLFDQSVHGRGIEGVLERRQLVECQAEAVDIATRVAPAAELLWCHEAIGPRRCGSPRRVVRPIGDAPMPKSVRKAEPARSIRMFEGFTSRWMIRFS